MALVYRLFASYFHISGVYQVFPSSPMMLLGERIAHPGFLLNLHIYLISLDLVVVVLSLSLFPLRSIISHHSVPGSGAFLLYIRRKALELSIHRTRSHLFPSPLAIMCRSSLSVHMAMFSIIAIHYCILVSRWRCVWSCHHLKLVINTCGQRNVGPF